MTGMAKPNGFLHVLFSLLVLSSEWKCLETIQNILYNKCVISNISTKLKLKHFFL